MNPFRLLSWYRPRGFFLCVVLTGVCSCSVDLNERRLLCGEASIVAVAHSVGDRVTVTPSPGHDWCELIREPFRAYGLPPVTIEELQERYGRPTLGDSGEERVEYLMATGKLWLQLDKTKSGRSVHESWRLRFELREPASPAEVFDPAVLLCVQGLGASTFNLVVLDREPHIPRVSARIREGRVRRLTWMNLGE